MAKIMNISVKHGCTLQSGKIFSVVEPVPRNITYAQLMEGIADNTYTVKSLSGHTFEGQIRDIAGGTILAELVFDVTNNMMSFSVPASITKTWPNAATTYYYDVKDTETATGIVINSVEGQVNIIPAMTVEE